MQVSVKEWPDCFPELTQSKDPAIKRLLESAAMVKVPAQSFVFHMGGTCNNYLLAVEGSIRVQLTAENGREVTLYRVRAGDSCILTTSCLLSDEHYPVEAIAESDVIALAIEHRAFQQALDESAEFRRFVFANFSRRLAHTIQRMEEITFTSIDKRLARVLLDFRASGSLSAITHQALAVDLGTAREVVSRHLKRFESYGWINLGRGEIEITDLASITRIRDTDAM